MRKRKHKGSLPDFIKLSLSERVNGIVSNAKKPNIKSNKIVKPDNTHCNAEESGFLDECHTKRKRKVSDKNHERVKRNHNSKVKSKMATLDISSNLAIMD